MREAVGGFSGRRRSENQNMLQSCFGSCLSGRDLVYSLLFQGR